MRNAILAFVTLVLLLGACSSSSPISSGEAAESFRSTTPSRTVTNEPASLSPADEEEIYELAFVATLRQSIPWMNSVSEDEIIALGHEACNTIDAINPQSETELLLAMAEATFASGVDAEEFGFVTGAATSAFCPEWQWIFQ